jgi:putative endopeptidase
MRLVTASLIFMAAACSSKPPTAATPAPAPAAAAAAAAPSAAPGPAVTPTAGSAVAAASGAPVTNVSLADVGLEAASLDRSADPCVDFYVFACGGWLQANQIPGDRARWGRFSEIDERNKAAIKTILDEDAKGVGGDPAATKVGDYYASCMDEAAIEKAGTKGIMPLLDKAQKVKDAKSWLAALTQLHKAGIHLVWRAYAAADLKDSTTNVTYLDASGLGLPDRDYYLKPDFKDKVEAYKFHVGKMLALLGNAQPKAAAAAADVIAIETELAKLTKTATERRDVQARYNPTEQKALAKQVKSVDWKAYWKALDVTPSQRIVIGTPKFFAALDAVHAKFKPAQWTSYFTYHIVEATSFSLPKAFDDEAFELKKALSGVEKQQDRYKRCIDATQGALGEMLGLQYVNKYFPNTAKQTAVKLVDALVSVMSDEIGSLEWMTDQTRPIAQAKLAKVVRMIGFPDKWKTYDFEVKRDDFAGNELRASAHEDHRVLSRAGKPVDRAEWQMDTYEVNAYYQPTANNTALPAGILQAPFFGQDRSVAANLGGIGMVIGHELTHGFDDQGAQFDADGNLKNWWQKDDKDKFEGKGTCVADQYSTFEASKDGFVNGRLTLGENIADLGGVKMAFKAYRSLRKGADKAYVADGFSEDQQFFLAVGQAWCSKDRPDESKRRLTVDPHSPPKFRVYGALRNLPEFARAFSCAQGTPMRPAKTCAVW